MKKTLLFAAHAALVFMGAAGAADVRLFYSPSCPHCHHARDFFAQQMMYEYPDIEIININVMDNNNMPLFQDAVTKCKFDNGGVPVIVVGEKCFQGYADFMQDDLRRAVESGMTDDQIQAAAAVRSAMTRDADGYRTQHTGRVAKMAEFGTAPQKKTDNGSMTYWYVLLGALVAGLIVVLGRRRK